MKVFKIYALILMLFIGDLHSAQAHGEKALEPFIRTRTIQWFDVQWSQPNVMVNDEIIVTGKFHVAEDWPVGVPKPDATFLNISAPGPVLIRTERYLNGQPWINSAALKPGSDYDFKVVLKARMPGRYHIHPFFNLRDAGPVMGPGQWIEIGGNYDDFSNKVTTLNGEVIDMESYGLYNGAIWHGLWMVVGLAWLIWWVRRPLFLPRYRLVRDGQEEGLITAQDRKIALVLLISIPVVVLGASNFVQGRYATAIPLQAALDRIEPRLPMVNTVVHVKVLRSEYSVTKRSMQMSAEIRNDSTTPISIAEFDTASLRFINSTVITAELEDADTHLIRDSLHIADAEPIAPGETRRLSFDATDAGWKNEKLDGLLNDADSRMGGLLVFYGEDGKRFIASISSSVLPVYR